MWNGDLSWWTWLAMSLGMLAVWGLVLWAVVLIVRGRDDRPGPERRSAEEILAQRLAQGEIGTDEYRDRLQALRTRAVEPRGHTG